jgi:AraC-like DNA-binding protein
MSLRPPADTPAVGRPSVERRLLVVGRDPGVTAVIAVGLRPRFETETGITVAEGLAQVGREPWSLIIADLAQGDLDAAFSIRALAARSPDCQIIVIGSTEHAAIADHLAGLHVYGFFTRPVDFGALVARVSLLSADDNSPGGGALALSRCSAKVLDFLSAHYADSFNLHTLARAVGVSPGSLARVFLHDTKRNLRSFRCDVRVEVAKQLLVHEDHKLDRVAEMTGFVDGSHLSRVFRVHTGRSPGQYRMNIRSPRPENARAADVARAP